MAQKLTEKKRRGDRSDAYKIRDIDPMHYIMAVVTPGRCNNEAYISETVDLANLNAYLAKKNENETEFKYTMFHVIVTAFLKVLKLRPKMNRFIYDNAIYQRKFQSASFVVKKKFADNGEEGTAVVYAKDEDPIDTIHEYLREVITKERSVQEGSGDNGTLKAMEIFSSMPKPISVSLLHALMWMDKHDMVPDWIISQEPYHHSLVISNVGSFGLHCGYHHLLEWGTNSLFCLIGEKEVRPVFQKDGSYEMREMVDLGITIDERLADGYYYAKSIKLLQYLLQHPEELEKPLGEEVDYNA